MNQPPLNPDALEAGHEAYRRAYFKDGAPAPRCFEKGLSAYLAAALPEATERGQLTALADKIVLEDRRGTIWQKINGNWFTPGSKHDYSDQSVMLPARVLYRPEVKP